MKTYIFIAGLLLTLTLAVAGLLQGCAKPGYADCTVGKPMSETFYMPVVGGGPRTKCNLSKFSVKGYRNGTSIAVSYTFHNRSTGWYTATCTPNAPGYHEAYFYYNNTSIGPCLEMVRLNDVDTLYGPIAAIPTTAPPSVAAIDTQLSGTHGSGLWGSGNINYSTIADSVWNDPRAAALIFGRYSSGTVLLPVITTGNSYLVYKGTQVPMSFALGGAYNLTGKKAALMIRKPGGSQDLVNAACTVTSAPTGACSYTLTSTQTNVALGKYTAVIEVENLDGTAPMVAMRFTITIASTF